MDDRNGYEVGYGFGPPMDRVGSGQNVETRANDSNCKFRLSDHHLKAHKTTEYKVSCRKQIAH